nr:uncharacterized protein LOC104091756 [Nicotiana tomentosiformis]
MSILCTVDTPTGRTLAFGTVPMTIHEMGDGYSWSTAIRSRKEDYILTVPSEHYGQAESTNKVISQNLKKRLETAKGKWPEELPGVLWAYQTTVKLSTIETYFSLVYGAEALILVELVEPTLMFSRVNEEANNEALLVKLDLLDECKDLAYVRMVAQNQRMERYYNWMANLHYFKVGDLVLRKVTQSSREINAWKLGLTWEGPYRVSAVIGDEVHNTPL